MSVLCCIVIAELLYGARLSNKVEDNLQFLKHFFSPLKSLPFNDRCSEEYGVNLKKILEEITSAWVKATEEAFTNHPIAKKIKQEFPASINKFISNDYPSYIIKSSAGAGNWANVPWLSILDPKITTTTQDGFYPVYLFKADGSGIYLSLIQGITIPSKLLGKKEAEKQAQEITHKLLESVSDLKKWGTTNINLAANSPLGKSYEISTIVSKFYPAHAIPDDVVLKKDLTDLLVLYGQTHECWNKIKQNEGTDISLTINSDNLNNNLLLPKPFILLSGISGTGKTRFVKQQANRFRQDNSNYCIVPVRPDWHEPSDLLGYISRLGSNGAEYIVTDFLQFIVAAWKDITQSINEGKIQYKNDCIPYWLCLDEMNLAPVEQYFADYLAIIETRFWDDGQYHCDALLNSSIFKQVDNLAQLRTQLNLAEDENEALWEYFLNNGISIPPNLIVAGTVNMDETTHGFSRKVIDRAFTLDFGEFFPNDYQAYFAAQTQPKTLGFPTLSKVDVTDIAEYDPNGVNSIAFLETLNSVLKETPFELAYRALNELLIAVVCFKPKNPLELQAVWDDFLMTKVLPRIEGDNEKLHDDDEHSLLNQLESILALQLNEIWTEPESRPDLLREQLNGDTINIACRSKKKLSWMKARLITNGFTSFWP